jgi:hypothetical protein
MNDQIENEQINIVDLKAALLSNAASTYAYNKINNILLMQILAKVENRDMEEIRINVERYIAEFADEYVKMNTPTH